MGFIKGLLTATAIVLVGSSKVFCFGKDMTQEKQYLNLYGWFLGEQCKLTELGLSKDEFKHLTDGMWMAINGEKTPINDQKDVDAMQIFLDQKNKDYRMKKDALNATIAKKNKQSADEFLANLDKKDGVQKSKTGLRYIIKNPGSSNKPDANDAVTVHYVGTLADG
ncbi:MAG: hypothetical protein EOM76_09625, partial [Sphingobacteriia bacterium]|nr:hypothetical protein [Sphingobacteriia bacterium]